MLLFTVSNWIDITVISVALIAVGFGIYAFRRLWEDTDSLVSDSPDVLTANPVATLSAQPKTTRSKATVLDSLQDQVSSLSKPAAPKPEPPKVSLPPKSKAAKTPLGDVFRLPKIKKLRRSRRNQRNKLMSDEEMQHLFMGSQTAPKLIAEQLTLKTTDSMLLLLRNDGGKLVYRKVQSGPNNQLKVRYQPPERRLNLMLEEFPEGSSIGFMLEGEGVINKTYQFTIHYGDMSGNRYRQQVSGLGKEYPIVEAPVKVD